MKRGDLAGARHLRQETESFVRTAKPGSAARRTGERLLDIMDAAFVEEAEDWGTLRRLRDRMSPKDTTELQRVASAISLAKADLAQGDMENARARLTYTADHGGTLYLVGEARHLMAEIDEKL